MHKFPRSTTQSTRRRIAQKRQRIFETKFLGGQFELFSIMRKIVVFGLGGGKFKTVFSSMVESTMDTTPSASFSMDIETSLKMYYNRLFPFRPVYDWLSYGNSQKNYFYHREIAFTYKDDIYSRYNCFADCESFRKSVISNCPRKIDYGAVYNAPPKNRQSITAFHPQEKELVFDVVRTCCKGADICNKCWPFMTVFIKVADHMLREDFGFQHVLWVYSGRRGVHCWVCDPRARKLSSEGRTSIVEFLSVIQGDKTLLRKSGLPFVLHPTLKWSYSNVMEPIFSQLVLDNQQMMATPENREKILSHVPLEEQTALREKFNKDGPSTTPQSKWADLKKTVEASKKYKTKFANPIQDIVFNFTFPRLDANVSKEMGHLLKAPFCVHPATGRVCVPIDPADVENFDPDKVPTVSDLISDIGEYDEQHKDTKGIKDYKKTRLAPIISHFKKQFLKPLLAESRVSQVKQENSATAMDF